MNNDESTRKVNQTGPDSQSEQTGQAGGMDAPAEAKGATQPPGAGDTKPAADDNNASSKADGEALKAQIAELTDRLQRSVAEQENMRKRLEREKADFGRYAVANFARDVLSVADNIQRAIDAVPGNAAERDPALKSFLDGIEVTERELLKVMERYGISRLNPEGEKFDPNFHQAIFEVPTADVSPGTVVQVVQQGYMLDERVLRPAMVGVSKAAPPGSSEGPGSERKSAQPAPKPASAGKQPKSAPGEGESEINEAASDIPRSEASGLQGQGPRAGSRLNEPVIGDSAPPRDRSRHG